MNAQLTDGNALVHEMMRLTEEAARFHGKMAGHVVFPESFIRDWVAIQLHSKHRFDVTIETGRADFREYVVEELHRPAHDLLNIRNYKLDMIVWEGEQPLAIVEFKRSPAIADDLLRTAAILSVVPRKALRGYLLVCEALGRVREKQLERMSYLSSMTAGRRLGDVLCSDPVLVEDGKASTWCGVFAVEVAPAATAP